MSRIRIRTMDSQLWRLWWHMIGVVTLCCSLGWAEEAPPATGDSTPVPAAEADPAVPPPVTSPQVDPKQPANEESPPEGAIPQETTPADVDPAANAEQTPEELLTAALDSMDRAAVDLDTLANTGQAVAEQQAAVDRLKQLLSQSSQSKSRSSKSPRDKPSPQDQNQSEEQPSESNSGDPGDSDKRRGDDENSTESSEKVDGPTVPGEGTMLPGAKVNNFWGHLPPRQREALFRSLSDQYLPEYEAQIRRYYEALAEKK